MIEDQPSGSCPCCSRRDPREGFACGPCRSKLKSWLGEIPDLFDELLTTPLAREGGMAKGGPVSGTPERQLPIRVDVFDLTHAGGWSEQLDEDQVGHLPVWETLRWWAGDWSRLRAMGEAGMPDVAGLCWWMRERVDEVADEHAEFAEAFHGIRRLRGALMAQLGRLEPRRVPCLAVPCKNDDCGLTTLMRVPGSEFIECDSCAHLLTESEYEAWTRELAARFRRNRILRSDSSAA